MQPTNLPKSLTFHVCINILYRKVMILDQRSIFEALGNFSMLFANCNPLMYI